MARGRGALVEASHGSLGRRGGGRERQTSGVVMIAEDFVAG